MNRPIHAEGIRARSRKLQTAGGSPSRVYLWGPGVVGHPLHKTLTRRGGEPLERSSGSLIMKRVSKLYWVGQGRFSMRWPGDTPLLWILIGLGVLAFWGGVGVLVWSLL